MAANGEQRPIELAELVRQLRTELTAAAAEGAQSGHPLQFKLGPVEIEATVAAGRDATTNGKVRFYVVDAGRDVKSTSSQTQRITLTLHPETVKPDGTTRDFTIAGGKLDGEL